ncbi:hypothetical protein COO51_02780 [Yersinia enterocolitica]|nr:hypothetical protein COO51_02780 [Yersinia enterocolitica]
MTSSPAPRGFFIDLTPHNTAILLHEMGQLCHDAPQNCHLSVNSLSLEVSA